MVKNHMEQKLNFDSPLPLYHQLAEVLLARIRAGEYPPGAKIPSEHELAADFGIGRPTARQATELLVRRRILTRRRGSGTFVREKTEEVDLFSLAGTMASFHEKGIPLSTQILQQPKILVVSMAAENPFAGRPAYFLSRLSRVEESPVLLEEIYLHPTLFAGIEGLDLTGRSLSRIVAEQYYMRPIGGTQHFRIGRLERERALQLAVSPETPILMVKRFLHFKQARQAIFAELFCRTDRFVFSQQIGGMDHEEERIL